MPPPDPHVGSSPKRRNPTFIAQTAFSIVAPFLSSTTPCKLCDCVESKGSPSTNIPPHNSPSQAFVKVQPSRISLPPGLTTILALDANLTSLEMVKMEDE